MFGAVGSKAHVECMNLQTQCIAELIDDIVVKIQKIVTRIFGEHEYINEAEFIKQCPKAERLFELYKRRCQREKIAKFLKILKGTSIDEHMQNPNLQRKISNRIKYEDQKAMAKQKNVTESSWNTKAGADELERFAVGICTQARPLLAIYRKNDQIVERNALFTKLSDALKKDKEGLWDDTQKNELREEIKKLLETEVKQFVTEYPKAEKSFNVLTNLEDEKYKFTTAGTFIAKVIKLGTSQIRATILNELSTVPCLNPVVPETPLK